MTAYYNEIDPYCAQWLRNLIDANLIAPGDVDERSIEDVRPDDIAGYTQCHFFAGIGVWSHALRLAGWPDDHPVWTGSCPCQPFSAAGKGDGFADERHLWPSLHHLIRVLRPSIFLGEQVEGKDGLTWLDLVQVDMEDLDYACGAIVTPSAGNGAPHIRHRQRIVAKRLGDSISSGLEGHRGHVNGSGEPGRIGAQADRPASEAGPAGGLADSVRPGWPERRAGSGDRPASRGGSSSGLAHTERNGLDRGRHIRPGWGDEPSDQGTTGWLGDSERKRWQGRESVPGSGSGNEHVGADTTGWVADTDGRNASPEREQRGGEYGLESQDSLLPGPEDPGPVNGFWRDSDWLWCRDERWRPVRPGSFPLAHGLTQRVAQLRAYGNAVDAQATKTFVESVMDII